MDGGPLGLPAAAASLARIARVMQPLDPSLVRFRAVVAGALAALEARRQEVNDLNVFPVADGDTGDNMVLTMRAVLDELDRLAAEAGQIDKEIGRDEIVDSVARAALLGARGNSGVILSQLLRGAAEELISRPGELIDPVLVAAAMARAAERAYGSVRDPAEGTILTVVREMAARVASEIAHMDEPRLHHHVDDDTQNAMIAEVLEAALRSGELSVARGPELLPILRDAGVVDAGGYGLTVMFAGVIAALRGTTAPELAHHTPARITHPQHESTTFRYCTNFAVTGEELDPASWNEALERFGDSVLVVGDSHTLKVHLHTDEPERATALFAEIGEVSHLDVADMTEQVTERSERLAEAIEACGVLAVVAGGGVSELFESVGAVTLDGGGTLNPSTYELLAGIHEVSAEEVVVLPNSPTVIMAAERAADHAEAMHEILTNVRTGAVTRAARDDAEGRFRRGEAVGFVDEQLVAWGEPRATLEAVLGELGREAELLTLIEGDGAPLDGDGVAALVPGGVDMEYSRGDQPAYWWLIAAE